MVKRGFTLLEVMVALAILAIGLVAIVGINGNSIRTHSYSKRVTVATMLARSKIADIESHYTKEGFTSEFDQRMEGDFSEEGWNDFRWEAEIVKADLDAQNATAFVEQLMDQMLGSAQQMENPSGGPTPDMSPYAQAMRPMIETQMTQLVEVVKQSLREVRLKVIWQEGGRPDSVDVVTHLVILAAAGQPGGASLDPAGAATEGQPGSALPGAAPQLAGEQP